MVQNKKYIWLNSSYLNSVIHDDDDQVKIKLSTKSCHFNYCWLHKVSEQSLHFYKKSKTAKQKLWNDQSCLGEYQSREVLVKK